MKKPQKKLDPYFAQCSIAAMSSLIEALSRHSFDMDNKIFTSTPNHAFVAEQASMYATAMCKKLDRLQEAIK